MWPPPAPCHGTSSASSDLCHSESVSPLTSASFEKTALASPSRRLVFEKRSAFTPGGSFSSTPQGDPPHRVSSQGEMSQLLTRSVGVSWLGHQGRRAQNTTGSCSRPRPGARAGREQGASSQTTGAAATGGRGCSRAARTAVEHEGRPDTRGVASIAPEGKRKKKAFEKSSYRLQLFKMVS